VKRVEHIFGPVRSRRLGLSLGVDLVPYKTCPFDCIYCQLGRTTHWTGERAEYVSASEVLEDLKRSLSQVPRPDFITLSGSGEPTLHSGIGEIIAGIRTITPIPIAVLTNGALFDNQDVRSGCGLADVVLPSLDAGDESTYAKVNRPLAGLTLRSLVDGLAVFREEFHGDIWLEVLLIRGITDGDEAVRKIARHAGNIRPDRIHLNTAGPPPMIPFGRCLFRNFVGLPGFSARRLRSPSACLREAKNSASQRKSWWKSSGGVLVP
jgi:wyosine [tRNA(Phe)-imidazoG37] synthetase (radical SAM superfamily)